MLTDLKAWETTDITKDLGVRVLILRLEELTETRLIKCDCKKSKKIQIWRWTAVVSYLHLCVLSFALKNIKGGLLMKSWLIHFAA